MHGPMMNHQRQMLERYYRHQVDKYFLVSCILPITSITPIFQTLAHTVEASLKPHIFANSPSFITIPRPISIGEPHYSQQEFYDFVPKILKEIEHKLQLKYSYITQNDNEAILQVNFF